MIRNISNLLKMKVSILALFFLILLSVGCKKINQGDGPYTPGGQVQSGFSVFTTDKARYNPGDKVVFRLKTSGTNSGNLHIRYSHMGSLLSETPMVVGSSEITWEWQPPTSDFQGYMVEVVLVNGADTLCQGTTAVDVSSDWTRFPRYGFLSSFSSDISNTSNQNVIDNLRDFHINGIQFYDWQNKHHWPLKMDGVQPAASWKDIANRQVSLNVVKNYIDISRKAGIASMFYNLLFGVWKDAEADGVSHDWYLFNNQSATDINKHSLPSGWASDIFLVNPGLTAWQNYIFQKTVDVYNFLGFDGWHVDQLGDRGALYSSTGQPVDLAAQFNPFLTALKSKFPTKKIVMNAVNQYGQTGILTSQVDFAYTEVWSPNNTYQNLADVILRNNELSANKLNTVLAAYMDYDIANQPGFFNEPGVLLTDAVIFAFGGSHLELGEHMLGKEYFPNDNLQMSVSLKSNLKNYYHFLTAYQNLLRDGGAFNFENKVTSTENVITWPPVMGSVSVVNKTLSSTREVFHFINFKYANTLNWRDQDGKQSVPIG